MFLTPDGRQVARVSRPVDHVLIIDDELALLEMLQTVVSTFGYEVTAASSVDEAEGLLTRQGTHTYQCVLTDYKMPGRNGLELLRWLRHFDGDLSIIVNTGYASHEDVSAMIREGAVDVLRKPVQMDLLGQAIAHGVRQTRLSRRRARAEQAVKQVGVVQGYMLRITGIRDLPWVGFYSRPMHQAGGDFVAYHKREGGGHLLILADVAGHNLDAAYISAFFHGAVHGMASGSMSALDMMGEVNTFLLEKWNDRDLGDTLDQAPEASVCAMFLEMDAERKHLSFHNNGLPPPVVTCVAGRSRVLGTGNSPLGLYEDPETYVEQVDDMSGCAILCFSDGLEDFAHARRVTPLALACRLHLAAESAREELLADADDDIMLMRVCMDGCGDEDSFLPVFMEAYAGDRCKDIDAIEDSWARSISFAVPELPDDKLYALLITAREAMLNALKHGCEGSPNMKATLHVAFCPALKTVRVIVEDPGQGYFDDFLTNPEPDMEKERHSGLVLIRNFPDKIWTERNNATVFAEFTWI
ncbi:MAG: response regulator [Opitutales bacterium]|nr:response regulator [Opitutales bacterium]